MQIFLDLETTNLAPMNKNGYCDYTDLKKYETCRIIQIYMCIYKNNRLIDEIYTYIDPKMQIPDKAKEITGITDEQVKNKKLTKEHIHKIKSFLSLGNIIIGHNITFDINILASELYRLNEIELAKILFNKKYFCTMKNAYRLQKGGKYIKLEALYLSFYKDKIGNAHDAKTDVLMCKKLYDVYRLFNKIKFEQS
jgi:DNA helicase-2/ATP-dependent DNA helicase PcrA